MKKSKEKRNQRVSLFPTPAYLSVKTLGVHITSTKVRILGLKKTRKGNFPKVHREVTLKSRFNVLDPAADQGGHHEVIEILEQARKDFKQPFATVCLPEEKTYIFKTMLPEEAIDTLEDSIAFSLEEHVPLNANDIAFDYMPLKMNRAGTLPVVVSALPKSTVTAYTLLLNEAGMWPINFVSASQALANAIIPAHDPTPHLVMNVGENTVSIAIAEENVVHYASSLPMQADNLIKDLGGQESRHLKEQINKLLVYWFTNKDGDEHREKIETLLLSGSYTTHQGFVEFLEKHLKINVRIANVWVNCFDVNDHIPELSYEESLDYGIATGLALSQ